MTPWQNIDDPAAAAAAWRADQLPKLEQMPEPRQALDLEPIAQALRVLALAMEGLERDFVVQPHTIPADNRCSWVGSRANIWSWAEPRGDRRPRFVLCGEDPLQLRVVDVLGLLPSEWPRSEIGVE